MKVDIQTKSSIEKLIEQKLRTELSYLYKELNRLHEEILRLDDIVKMKRNSLWRT